MSVKIARNRTIAFRMSSDEHAKMIRAVERNGARSISDFVRETVLGTVGQKKDSNLEARLEEVERRVADLEKELYPSY